jgi:hypothetical protein
VSLNPAGRFGALETEPRPSGVDRGAEDALMSSPFNQARRRLVCMPPSLLVSSDRRPRVVPGLLPGLLAEPAVAVERAESLPGRWRLRRVGCGGRASGVRFRSLCGR